MSGHGRLEDLERRVAAGEPPPDYVDLDGDDWLVPIVRGGTFETDREAEAYLLATNRTVELGGWDLAALDDFAGDDPSLAVFRFGEPTVPAVGANAEPDVQPGYLIEIRCTSAQYVAIASALRALGTAHDLTIDVQAG